MALLVNIGLIVIFGTLTKGDTQPCDNLDYANMNAIKGARLLGYCSLEVHLKKYENSSHPIENLPTSSPNKRNCTYDELKNRRFDLALDCFLGEINFDDDLETVRLKLRATAAKFAARFTDDCPILEIQKLTFAQSMTKYYECTAKEILLGMAFSNGTDE